MTGRGYFDSTGLVCLGEGHGRGSPLLVDVAGDVAGKAVHGQDRDYLILQTEAQINTHRHVGVAATTRVFPRPADPLTVPERYR